MYYFVKKVQKNKFLKVVLKECSLNAKIYNCRIEDIIMNNIAIIVSRAYASIMTYTNKYSFDFKRNHFGNS